MALHDLLVRLGLQAQEFQNGIKAVTADLKQVEKNTTATTTVMKAAWRDLGIKSTEYIEAKKASVTKAYETIRASGVYSAQEVLRAEQAKNAKLQSLDEQHFGKQTSFIDSMKSNWIAATIAIGVAMAALHKGWVLAEASAEYIEQMAQLDALAKKYGTSATAIVGEIRKIGDGMISMATASQVGLSGLAKGLNPEMIYGLAKAAVVLKDIMGVTANESFKQMAEALEANKVKSLKLAVGTIDLKDRYGELADKMTEAEKQVAYYNLIMEKAAVIQGQVGSGTKSIADEMEAFKVRAADLKIELGIYLIKAGMGVIGTFQGIYSASLLAAAGIWKIIEGQNRLKALFTWGDWKKDFLANADIAASMARENWENSGKAAIKAQDHLKLMMTSTDNLIKSEKQRATVIGSITSGVKKQEDAAKELAEAQKKMMEAAKKGADEVAKMYDNWVKGEEEAGKVFMESNWEVELKDLQDQMKDTGKEIDTLYDKWIKDAENAGAVFMTQHKEEEKDISDRTAAYKEMYNTLKNKASGYYDYLKDDLVKQANDYATMTGDAEMAAVWLKERLIQLDIEKGKSSNSFFDGVKAGLAETLNNLYTWGQAGYDMFKTFTSSMSSTFSSVFKDAIAGNLKSFGDYFKSFWDTMLNKFVDILAQMLTEWLIFQAAKKASEYFGLGIGGGGGGGGGNGGPSNGGQIPTIIASNLASRALYSYLFPAAAPAILPAGPIMLAEESALMVAPPVAEGGLTIGAIALPVLAALATQQVIEHGPTWLANLMGSKIWGHEEGLIQKLAVDELVGGGEYPTQYKYANEFGAPDYLSNPLEIAQYQTDMARQYNEGIDYLNLLRASDRYTNQLAQLQEMGDINYWRNFQEGLNASIMHGGGILKAHRGLVMGPDEGLFFGLSDEGILPRPSMRKLGLDNFEALRTGNFERVNYGEGGDGGGITVNFNIGGNLIADQQVFDEFVEKIDYALDKRSRRVYAA